MQPSLFALFKRHHALRDLPIWAMIAVLRALAWLPMPLLYAIGAAVGELTHCLHRSRKRITRRNLSACFPHKSSRDIRRLTRAHFRAMAAAVLVGGVSWWGGELRLRRLTRFANRAIFDSARKRGENIILLVPHFTALEHGGIFLSAHFPMLSMYRRHKNPLLDAIVKSHRSRFGIIQCTSAQPTKSLIQNLRHGHIFYYLPDQDPGRHTEIFAPFYSIPAATYASLGRIARLGAATVIPCATRLLPFGRGFEIIFAPPLADYPSGDAVRDATTMNRAIESLIPHAPAQYFWSHRRFKTRPAGEEPFYE